MVLSMHSCRNLGLRLFPTRLFKRCHSASSSKYEYDLVVVGGGSGGLACAKEAADYGMKVAVLDFVEPSPHGTKWGLGGTCVNVGCIPKKLMHRAALLGEELHDARRFGWEIPSSIDHSWPVMSSAVQGYVRSLNWGHNVQLRKKDIKYLNAKGKFRDANHIEAVDNKGREHVLSTRFSVISVGGRPIYPEIPGIEKAISSDDIFWKKSPPLKTLVIGGSYVALECAGFLTGLGFDTAVMVRSICLRGFDQQMSQLVTDHMKAHGTRFIWPAVPTAISEVENGLEVSFRQPDGSEAREQFQTVLVATGRAALTSDLNLEAAGVTLNPKNSKVIGGFGGEAERTAADSVFAIGDVLDGRPELTPVAAKSGRLLARRLAGKSQQQMEYEAVPTTVFTPLEYACIGQAEEEAEEELGKGGVEIYHAFYQPLEFTVPERDSSRCYIKAICRRDSGKITGLHLTGPSAGEMMQGFAAAFKMGLTYEQLSSTVGIHPTCAEEVVKLNITKRSGNDPTVTGC